MTAQTFPFASYAIRVETALVDPAGVSVTLAKFGRYGPPPAGLCLPERLARRSFASCSSASESVLCG